MHVQFFSLKKPICNSTFLLPSSSWLRLKLPNSIRSEIGSSLFVCLFVFFTTQPTYVYVFIFLAQFECEMPLGMENGKISDADIETETNSFDANSGPEKARLRSPTGYRADPEALNRTLLNYILVKLPKEMIITGIATQGLGKEWVKEFELLADKNQSELISFKDVVNGTTLKKVRQLSTAYLQW